MLTSLIPKSLFKFEHSESLRVMVNGNGRETPAALTSILLTILGKKEIPNSSVLEKIEEKSDSTEPEIPKSD